MIQQGISELLEGGQTPTVDEIIKQIDQMIQQEQQAALAQQAQTQEAANNPIELSPTAAPDAAEMDPMAAMGEMGPEMGGETGGLDQLMAALGGGQAGMGEETPTNMEEIQELASQPIELEQNE
jgi:hypothetical protein